MTVSILQWNIRNFRSHKPFLETAIDTIKPSIIALQETHTHAKQTISLANYHYPPIRYDRHQQRGGGAAVFIRRDVPHLKINLTTDLEAAAAQVFFSGRSFTLCSIYLPPTLVHSDLPHKLEQLCTQLPHPFLLCLDANAHHPEWGSPYSDSRGEHLSEWIEDHSLVLLNTGAPTYISPMGTYSHIDLTICTPELASILQWSPYHDLMGSDHYPLQITTELQHHYVDRPPRYNFQKADWARFNRTLVLPKQRLSPTQACGALTDAIKSAAATSIPLQSPPKHKSSYWWTPECTEARRAQHLALTQYNNHKGNMTLWVNLKRAQAKFKYEIKLAKKQTWTKFISTLNSSSTTGEVWDKIRRLRSKRTSRHIVLHIDNRYLTSPTEVSEALLHSFTRKCNGISTDPIFVQNKINAEKTPIVFPSSNTAPYNRHFTMPELQSALKASTSKSAGPDNIPYEIIQHLSQEHLYTLLDFYNYLYDSGYPHQWREGNTVPICKPCKDPTDPSSYRPITLLNCIAKLMGRMVTRRLQQHLEELNFYSPYQSGFRSGHSTLDSVTRLEHSARNALLHREYCVAVFLDISNAFDSVWHHGLLTKLRTLGLTGNLARYIQQFLQWRKIQVTSASTSTSSLPLHAGVPQGSVISPTLFTIMMDDIFDGIPQGVDTSLYADDGAMWYSSPSLDTALQTMQKAIDKVTNWSQQWGLSISPTKTTVLIFTARNLKNPTPLAIDKSPLPFVSTTKFLGVHFDSRLTWRTHICAVRDKCRRDLQLMRSVTGTSWGSDQQVLQMLYTSLILSKLDYASFLYNNAAPTNLLTLDRIQYAGARIILGALKCTPNYLLEAEADLIPLAHRRDQMLLQYSTRVSTISRHPVTKLIQTYQPFQDFVSTQYKLSAIGHLHDLKQKLPPSPPFPPTIPLSHRLTTFSLPARSTLCSLTPKHNQTQSQWQAAFKHLCATQYTAHTHIYTDGSSDGGRVLYGTPLSPFSLAFPKPLVFSPLNSTLFSPLSNIYQLTRVSM